MWGGSPLFTVIVEDLGRPYGLDDVVDALEFEDGVRVEEADGYGFLAYGARFRFCPFRYHEKSVNHIDNNAMTHVSLLAARYKSPRVRVVCPCGR